MAASQKMIQGILEHTYFKHNRRSTFVAMADVLEEVNCFWDSNNEVPRVMKLWNMGVPLDLIAKVMCRPVRDTEVLLYDLKLQKKIKDRPGGMDGGMSRVPKTASNKSSDAQISLF